MRPWLTMRIDTKRHLAFAVHSTSLYLTGILLNGQGETHLHEIGHQNLLCLEQPLQACVAPDLDAVWESFENPHMAKLAIENIWPDADMWRQSQRT